MGAQVVENTGKTSVIKSVFEKLKPKITEEIKI